MKMKFILFITGFLYSLTLYTQSGLILGSGISMAYTDNPNRSMKGEMFSGFHISLTGRFGSDSWYLKPGVEFHRIKIQSRELLNPFTDEPALSILKFPAQLGLKLVNLKQFKFRIMAGGQFSYVASIDDNTFTIDHDSVRDTQFGALLGAGIDLSWLSIEINFEKGLTEYYTGTNYITDYLFFTLGFFF